jgi:deoxynucleoside triphosphate triphosphohydrolase SAMHD1
MLLDNPALFGSPKYLIMDPVHGGIDVFSHEQRIIDHPLFLRLRHIKQNDILQYVFPGATHTRFEHSLGTMHIAGMIFRKMLTNYLSSGAKKTLQCDEIESFQYLYGCLRVAALLHDLGHMPFSHQFENSPTGKVLMSNNRIIKALWKGVPANLKYTQPTSMHHEHLSIRYSIEILTELSTKGEIPFDINDIIGMMENGETEPSKKFIDSANTIIKILSKGLSLISIFIANDIALAVRKLFKDIISGEVDADKMDYLLRDSYFSGCQYGIYNIDHLIQNLCIGFDIKTSVKKSWFGIAIRSKGIGALEDFVFSRFKMYLHVYNHKTVVGFKWLLNNAITEIFSIKKNSDFIKDALSKIDQMPDLTDTYLWECFREYAVAHKNSACHNLINRIKLNHIVSIENIAEFEKDDKKKELEKQLKKGVVWHEASSRFSKITPTFSQLRILDKNKIEDRHTLKSVNASSTFFKRFEDITVTHFYFAPDIKV